MAAVFPFLTPLLGLLDKIIPDKTAAAEAKAQLQQMTLGGQLAEDMAKLTAVTTAQSDIDKVEAGSTNWFVAGGRPFVIWICAAGLALNLVFAPIFTWATALLGHPTPFPTMDSSTMMGLLFPLLGLGAYRTIEKVQGVANNH
jgi:Holin of 3TMs, for gene-transfer release